jgi:group I intron endonuclease
MIIYLIKNIVNNKVYVGQTINPLKRRKYGHIADSNRGKNTKISRAMKKYGKDNFVFSELISCNNSDELNEMELYFINEYKSIDDSYGYNIKIGGECGFKVSEETKIKISIASKKAAQRAKDNGGHWLSGRKHSEEEKAHLSKILSSELNPKNKPVLMYDKEGNFIKRFHSARESGRCIGKGSGNIISCCNNKLKSAYGYKWIYEDKSLTMT